MSRESELKTLEKLYRSEHFEFVVIYGRRRIGKTALINEFMRKTGEFELIFPDWYKSALYPAGTVKTML